MFLVYSPNIHNSWSWDSLKSGARNSIWISCLQSRVKALGPSPTPFPSALSDSWIRSGTDRTWTSAHMGCLCCGWHLHPLCHNTVYPEVSGDQVINKEGRSEHNSRVVSKVIKNTFNYIIRLFTILEVKSVQGYQSCTTAWYVLSINFLKTLHIWK